MIKFVVISLCALSVLASPVKISRGEGRIIGGDVARAGQFPFAAALSITKIDGSYFCGGTLLNDANLATAAQCVDGATLISIHLGSNAWNGNEGMKLTSDSFVVHPQYDAMTLDNDIAIVKFRLPILFTDYIQPVNFLPDIDLPAGSAVLTFGWGQTNDEDAGLANELNYVYLVALTNEECKLTFGSQITNNMVCVDGNYNQGTCIGDTGSPLIQYGSRGITYFVGIASFVSGNGCESTDPSGFAKVNIYKSWIQNVTTTY